MRARLLGLLFIAASAACTAHVEGPVAVDDGTALLDCENRVMYVGSVGATGGPTVYELATTVATFQYDHGGRIMRYRETASDGTTIAQIDRTYEATERHRPLARTFSATYRPSPVLFAWTYDDANHAVRTDDDELIGGRWFRTTAGERYDESGRIVLAWAAVDRQGDLTFSYPDADTVLGTSLRDGLVQRLTLLDGRWVTRAESLYRGRVDGTEVTTYDTEKRPLVRAYTSSQGTETTTVEWSAGHVQSVGFHVPNRIDRRIEFYYDGAGRLVEKRYLGPDANRGWASDTWLSFEWDGSRLVRVERRRLDSRVVLQRWDFAYGCPFDDPRHVTELLAPVSEWARELDEVPFTYDFRALWAPVSR